MTIKAMKTRADVDLGMSVLSILTVAQRID